ncbi:MAG: PAS domain S-box protein, partial [Anaerohalosphaera sp.]|nr:PAS domain S-box protein [Anaerohalosphaera sp.]
MDVKKVNVNTRIFLPIVLVITSLLIALVVTVRQFHHNSIHNKHIQSLKETTRLFQTEIDEDTELMNGILDFLKQDKTLQNIWLANDRQSLLDYAAPIFEDMSSKYRITHFYFHNLNQTCFLRVHNPPGYGDLIDRYTMAEAKRQGKPFYGIELEPLGTFTLRTVHPWYIEDKLAGYIELGEEIEHITQELKDILGCQYIFVINKSFLDRAKWQEGLKMIDKTGQWDMFDNFVVIDSTLDKIPSGMGEQLQRHSIDHNKFNFDISSDNKYLGGFVGLHDVAGTEVGEIIVLSDITMAIASERKLLAFLITISTCVGSGLCAFFRFYIDREEQKITMSNKLMQAEIVQRKQAQKHLSENTDKIVKIANEIGKIMSSVGVTADNKYLKFQNPDLVKCHEIINCMKKDCPAYNTSQATRCWEIDGTFCNGQVQGGFAKKIKDCRKCEVYRTSRINPVCNLGESFNEMMLLLEFQRDSLENALKDSIKAKTEAEDANSRFKHVAESAEEWIWETDAKGMYTYSSIAVEKILGYKPEDIVGKKYFYDFFEPQSKEEIKKAALEAFCRKESFSHLVNVNLDKYGNPVVLLTSGFPIIDSKGDLAGYRGTDTDITELKKTEESLIQAKEKAEVANIAKSQF